MGSYALSRRDLAFYRRNGYLVVPNLLDPEELNAITRTIDDIVEEQRPLEDHATKLEWEPQRFNGVRVPRRIYRPVDEHEVFYEVAVNSKILDRLESILGPDIQLTASRLNFKAAYVGSPVEWHQDITYNPHTNTDVLTCVIYLDDATSENGSLQVIPGAHGRVMDHSRGGFFVGKITESVPRDDLPAPVVCEAPAGSVIILHCLTPHSSLPNQSGRPRRALVYEYRASDAYPIYFHQPTPSMSERQVRGRPSAVARFSLKSFPIPQLRQEYRSLYELQAADDIPLPALG